MAYTKQEWENLPATTTPLSAERMAHLETQYDEAVAHADSKLAEKADLVGGKVPNAQLNSSTTSTVGTVPVRGSGGRLTGIGTPTVASDAATKAYVDANSGGSGPDPDPVSLAIPEFDVTKYGAVNNGITDCSAAIQAAIDDMDDQPSILYFPPGGYKMNNLVRLKSNTHITGRGATITKAGGGMTTSLAFAALGNAGWIYNVSISNLSFSGSLPGRGIMVLWGHRLRGLRVWNIDVTDAVTSGHCFDLQGCIDSVIERSTFSGCAPQSGREYAECIQLDWSGRGGSPADTTGQVYDGTITEQLIVRNCRFLKQGSYPAPHPLGNHGVLESRVFRRIEFVDNYVETPEYSSSYTGVLNLLACNETVVKNNTFNIDSGKGFNAIVNFQDVVTWTPFANIDNASPGRVNSNNRVRGASNTVRGNISQGGTSSYEMAANDYWNPLSFQNGFKDYSSSSFVKVYYNEGNVEITGVAGATDVTAITGNSAVTAFNLPAELRPRDFTRTLCGGSGSAYFMLTVNPSGGQVALSRYSVAGHTNPYLTMYSTFGQR